jgi:WD40 repeat protein
MRRPLLAHAFLLLLLPLLAQEPATEPEPEPDESEVVDIGKVRLTLDPGDHVGYISRLLFTPDGNELLSAGRDHTVRVWDARTGDLLRVLRPPGNSQAMHMAVSPDGKTLAVTAFHDVGKGLQNVVCLMSVADGSDLRVLPAHTGGPGMRIAFTGDGKRLIAYCADSAVRIWDLEGTASPKVMPTGVALRHLTPTLDGSRFLEMRDDDHTGRIRDLATGKVTPLATGKMRYYLVGPLAWSPDGGTAATATLDGVKLWSLDGKLLGHYLPKVETASVAFSRDGKKLLVTTGVHFAGTKPKNPPRAILLDAATGKKEREFFVSAMLHNARIGTFSADGSLIATEGGDASGGGTFVWNAATGEVLWRRSGPTWIKPDVRVGWAGDGRTVAWGTGKRESLDLDQLAFGPPLGGKQFHGAVYQATVHEPKHTITYELKTFPNKHPKIFKTVEEKAKKAKEKSVKKTEELPLPTPRALGGNKGDGHTFVGNDRVAIAGSVNVFLMDLATKKLIRAYKFRGWVRSMAPSPNGRYLMVAAEDQILHIVDPKRDGEVLSVYVNDHDWVAWTPEGYYASSPGGERLIGWTIQNGIDKEVSYHPASRFRESLYRPDVIKRILTDGNLAKALANADKARAKETKEVEVAQVLPPEVKVTITPGAGDKVTVVAEAVPSGPQPIRELHLLVDDRPYAGLGGIFTVENPKVGPVRHTWEIALPGPHEIRVLARTEASLGSSRGVKRVDAPQAAAVKLPNLYVVAVGINEYPKKWKLDAAADDARNFIKAVNDYSPKVFGDKPQVKEVLDTKATKTGILAALDWLKERATPNDVSVFFFAGHGELANKEFYLLPQDFDEKDLTKTGVSRAEIKERVQKLPGKVLLLLDACHSGAIGLLYEDGLSRQLADEDCGVAVLCAARPSEFALEKGQGFFTQALISGLAGLDGCPQRNGRVFVHHLQSHVVDRVADLSKEKQHPVAIVPPWMRPFALSQPAAK